MGEPSIGGFAYPQNGGFLHGLEKQVLGGKLSTQGSVALVCYAVLIAGAAVSPVLAARMGWRGDAGVVAFGIVISAAVSVYGINCLVVGGCKTLSWVYVSLLAFWTAMLVLGLLVIKFGGRRQHFSQDVDERSADFMDSRLKPDAFSGEAAPLYPGQKMPGSAGDLAATSNALIIDQTRDTLYEGYDAEGTEQGAPMPYVEGEMASASA